MAGTAAAWAWLAAGDSGLVPALRMSDRLHDLVIAAAMTLTIVIVVYDVDAKLAYEIGRTVGERRKGR